MPNFSSLGRLEVPEKFVWWGGWVGGFCKVIFSSNPTVVLRLGWGFDNIKQYITHLHANSASFESDPPALTCFHMNFQASTHQPRDVTHGANKQMVAPMRGSKRPSSSLHLSIFIGILCHFLRLSDLHLVETIS